VTVNEALIRYQSHVDSDDRKRDKPTSRVLLVRLSPKVIHEKFGDPEARRFGPMALKPCQDEFVPRGLAREECNRRVRLVYQFFGRSERS
jgi:hypothetical protein